MKKSQGKLPLGLRLKAWWDGYDAKEVEKRYVAANPSRADNKRLPTPTFDETPEADPVDVDLPLDPWDAQKVDIAQYIWGKGFCGPGGPDYIISLSKLMALSPEISMMQIGAALGGPARVLAHKFGVWINGFEESEALVKHGNEMSTMQGMEKKVTLEHYDPEDLQGFDRKFDRALAKESLFTIENKAGMIERIEEKLKPGGLMLVTDFVAKNDAVFAKEAYKEWKVGERRNPYLILPGEYQDLFKSVKLQVRVAEDISGSYIDMIQEAWAGADEIAAQLTKEENGPALIQILMKEAEFWTRRKKLMESGDLQLWRFVANKKSGGPGMMSDW